MAHVENTDQHLIDLCNGANAARAVAAFDELYRRHRQFVLRVALRYAGDHQLALDAMQDTFMWLLGRFPPDGPGITLTAKLTTLLYPVARSKAVDARRRFDPPTSAEPLDTAVEQVAPEERAADLHEVLARLPEERREVLVLRFVEDFSLQDIAAALAIPLGTVKSRIHLAVKALRDDPVTRAFFDRNDP
ncbi:MAG: sigma-70 family RNA polymerase sigma factor [Pseudomonadota bacterium]